MANESSLCRVRSGSIADGNPQQLDANGRPIYSQIIEFADRATADRFGAMILDLVRAAHPDDLAASP